MSDKIEIKKEGAKVEIKGELPADEFAKYRKKAVANLGQDVEMPGFRKGHIPENIIVQKFGEESVLSEMAELALRDLYPRIVLDNKIDAIGSPQVNITKIGVGSKLGFTITTAVLPEIALPDYKKIAGDIYKKEIKIDVTDKDVEETILDIRRKRADREKIEQKKKEGETQEQAEAKLEEKDLPELNDEFVKTLGDFKDVADFKAKIREGIKLEKTQREQDKRRVDALEAIMKKMDVEIPDPLLQGELDRMMAEFEGTLSQAGATIDDYLAQTHKTKDEIRKEWKSDAERRVKAQLTLDAIAKKEHIAPTESDIAPRVSQLASYYPGSDPNRLRAYVEMMLSNEMVFDFLSGNDKKEAPEKKESPEDTETKE